MIIGLDSAIPPTLAQAQAARAAGVGLWAGYFAGPNILNGWTRADFDRVKAAGLATLAYCSGWADPTAMKAQGLTWQVPICLDDESAIRPEGAWVQPWLDLAASGLYGVRAVHVGRRAAFHIAAWYPGADPGATYPTGWDGAAPCGWQWLNTHTEFGVGVDRGWYDDAFGGVEMLDDATLVTLHHLVQFFCFGTVDPSGQGAFVNAVKAGTPMNSIMDGWYGTPQALAWREKLAGLGQPQAKLGPFDATISPK